MKSFLARRDQSLETKTPSSPFKVLIRGEPSSRLREDKNEKLREKHKENKAKENSCSTKLVDRDKRKAKKKPENVIQNLFPRNKGSEKKSIRIYSSLQKVSTQDGRKITNRQHPTPPLDKKLDRCIAGSRRQNLLSLITSNQNLATFDQTSPRTKSIDRKKISPILSKRDEKQRGTETSLASFSTKECEFSSSCSSDKYSSFITSTELQTDRIQTPEKQRGDLVSIDERSISEQPCTTSKPNLNFQSHQNDAVLQSVEEDLIHQHHPHPFHQEVNTRSLKTYHKKNPLGTQNVEVDSSTNLAREDCQASTFNQPKSSLSTENWLNFLKGHNLPLDLEARKRFMTEAIENLASTELPCNSCRSEKTDLVKNEQPSAIGSCNKTDIFSKPCNNKGVFTDIKRNAESCSHKATSPLENWVGEELENVNRNRPTLDGKIILPESTPVTEKFHTGDKVFQPFTLRVNPRIETSEIKTGVSDDKELKPTHIHFQMCPQGENLQALQVNHEDCVNKALNVFDNHGPRQVNKISLFHPVDDQFVANEDPSKIKNDLDVRPLEQSNQAEHEQCKAPQFCDSPIAKKTEFLQEPAKDKSSEEGNKYDSTKNSKLCNDDLVRSIHGLIDIEMLAEKMSGSPSNLSQPLEADSSDCDASYIFLYTDKRATRISPSFLKEALKLKSSGLSKPLDEQSHDDFLGSIRDICEEIMETQMRSLKSKKVDNEQTNLHEEKTSNTLEEDAKASCKSRIEKISHESCDSGGTSYAQGFEQKNTSEVCELNETDLNHESVNHRLSQASDFGKRTGVSKSSEFIKTSMNSVGSEKPGNTVDNPSKNALLTNNLDDEIVHNSNDPPRLKDSNNPKHLTKKASVTCERPKIRSKENISPLTKSNSTKNTQIDGTERISSQTNLRKDHWNVASICNQQMTSNEPESNFKIDDLSENRSFNNLENRHETLKLSQDIQGKEAFEAINKLAKESCSVKNTIDEHPMEPSLKRRLSQSREMEQQTSDIKAVGDSEQCNPLCKARSHIDERELLKPISLVEKPQDLETSGALTSILLHDSEGKMQNCRIEEEQVDRKYELRENDHFQAQVVLRRDSKQSILNTTEGVLKVPTSNIDKQPVKILFEEVVPFINPNKVFNPPQFYDVDTVHLECPKRPRNAEKIYQSMRHPPEATVEPPLFSKRMDDTSKLRSWTLDRRRHDPSYKLPIMKTMHHSSNSSEITYRVISPRPQAVTTKPYDCVEYTEFSKRKSLRGESKIEGNEGSSVGKPDLSIFAKSTIEDSKLKKRPRNGSKSPNKLKDNTFGVSYAAKYQQVITIKQTKSVNLPQTESMLTTQMKENNDFSRNQQHFLDGVKTRGKSPVANNIDSGNTLGGAMKSMVFKSGNVRSAASYSSFNEAQKLSNSSLCSRCKSQTDMGLFMESMVNSRKLDQSTFDSISDVKLSGSEPNFCHLCKIEKGPSARNSYLSKTRLLSEVNIFNRTSTDVCLKCELTKQKWKNESKIPSSAHNLQKLMERQKIYESASKCSVSSEDLSSVNPVKTCTSFIYQRVSNTTSN